MDMKTKILPSLLAADFGKLAQEIIRAEESGADELHLDIMDGIFVPNISFGPAIVALAKRTTSLPLNVHLMITRPDLYVEKFAQAGASTIQIHVESTCVVSDTLKKIKSLGVKPALVLNPETSHKAALPYLDLVDEILQMTVYPGFGGQKFKPEPLSEVKKLREIISADYNNQIDIMVDGGVDRNTIVACAQAGANSFVAGTALFSKENMGEEVKLLRELISTNNK